MSLKGKRKLRDGREVPVYHNDGLRKICGCPRRRWVRCRHGWHLSFCWRGTTHRLSLDRHTGKHIANKTNAESLAERIRTEIRAGTFRSGALGGPVPADHAGGLSFEAFGEIFLERKSKDSGKVSWKSDASMLRTIMALPLPAGSGRERLGDKPVGALTEDDAEAVITHVAGLGRARSTVNHFVQILKGLSKWAVVKGYRQTPFVAGESVVIRRKKGCQRNRRLHPGEEDRLLAVAGPHLQNLIVGALESGCRLGELLTLQWRDVSLARHELIMRAQKTKTGKDRVIPVSHRLEAVLVMAQTGPEGHSFGPDDFG